MLAIRKWLYKPKKTDFHPLGRFYFADLDLVDISKELDSFDGRQDPERCTVLVNRLRTCQDRVLGIIEEILQDSLGNERASREFRAKFPDDVLQETLGGQLWFGAECLAAGSVILNREIESAALRPLARFLTRTIDSLRMILRDHCYKNTTTYSTKVKNALQKFDEVFAEFELSYVSAMVPVKSALEYDTLQDVIVMFCQTLERALTTGLLTQEEVDDYEPGLMVTIPRLAILSGLVIFPEGPLNLDTNPDNISELFKPFYQLLFKIRQLLRTLTTEEVHLLEKALCSNEHSWEDIEKQLNELQLSYEESGSYYDAQSYISPVESSVTECETACSSVPSFSMLEDRLRVEANDSWCDASVGAASMEATRKSSLPPSGTPIPDAEVVYCHKGHAKSEGINIPSQKRRRRRSQPPVVSPESLEVDTSCRKKGTVRQTSRRKSSSDSEKRDATNCRPETDVTCNGVEAASAPCQTARTTVEREDSGLGTPSHCCSMENTSPESCQDNFACDGSEKGDGAPLEGLIGQPPQGDKNIVQKMTETDDIFREDKNTKRKLPQVESAEFKPNGVDSFLHFGKGLASTELNTTDSVGTTIHDVFDNEMVHSLMWATVDSSGDASHESDSTSSQRSRLRLRNPSGSSTGSNIQTTSGMNRVTGLLGLAAASNRTGSTGSSMGSCGSTCSCCSYSDGEEEPDYQWESDDSDSESSLTDNPDAQEIKMAIQAAEIAARQEVRSRFSSSSDLVHRLFVCISGVADQLQTNYASDLRGILKTVFEVCAENPTYHGSLPPETSTWIEGEAQAASNGVVAQDKDPAAAEGASRRRRHRSNGSRNRAHSMEEPPPWVSDDSVNKCLACKSTFTVLRRKHHCRNCGKIFCARCSANMVPLPRFGQSKPVRVCNRCYMFQVTPFQP
ncbi:lateral signaling target protein 2 homolog isoform X2 [Apostichopus japonicus]|uniref:lateral signaling target protein 2 homolog isoform X2 n=1 Tax=Stichopus japonicus TaxID=307972 RepID=UPI003AB1C164